MQETENGKRKRSLGSVRDDDTRARFPHISFHPAAEANLHPVGPPPSTGRRENAAHRRLPHMGKAAVGGIFPPSGGRRRSNGVEVGFRSGMKRNVRKARSRIVIPNGAEGSFSFAVFCFLHESVCGKHRDCKS